MEYSSSTSGTQSIDRTIQVLKTVASHNVGGITLAEIARQADLKTPTAHRILSCLVQAGLLMQRGTRKEYFLGMLAYEIGLAANCHFNLRELCAPVLARLGRATGDTAFLTKRSGADSVVIDRQEGSYPVKVLTQMIGESRPLGTTAGGLALLAACAGEEREDMIRRNRARLGRYGKLTESGLRGMLERAAEIGYALNDGDLIPEVTGIGVAIPTALGTPYVALSVVGLRGRLEGPRRERTVALLKEEAARLGGILAGGM